MLVLVVVVKIHCASIIGIPEANLSSVQAGVKTLSNKNAEKEQICHRVQKKMQ